VVLRLDPSWARFAPLTSAGVVLAAGVVGVGSQVLDELGFFDNPTLDVDLEQPSAAWWLLVPLALLGIVVVVSTLAVAGYLLNNWNFTLSHAATDRSWHLTRGLLTTRETSIDDERLSGVSIGEPLGLRLAGGGRLSAIVTGLDNDQRGSSMLVPPAPVSVVHGVAGEDRAPGPAATPGRCCPRWRSPPDASSRWWPGPTRGSSAPDCSPWSPRSRSPPTGRARWGTRSSTGTSWPGPAACSASARRWRTPP
jgi:hypothetical protein